MNNDHNGTDNGDDDNKDFVALCFNFIQNILKYETNLNLSVKFVVILGGAGKFSGTAKMLLKSDLRHFFSVSDFISEMSNIFRCYVRRFPLLAFSIVT